MFIHPVPRIWIRIIDPVLPWDWNPCAKRCKHQEHCENHLVHIHCCSFLCFTILKNKVSNFVFRNSYFLFFIFFFLFLPCFVSYHILQWIVNIIMTCDRRNVTVPKHLFIILKYIYSNLLIMIKKIHLFFLFYLLYTIKCFFHKI